MINNLTFLHTPFSLGLKTFRAEKAKKGVLTYCLHFAALPFHLPSYRVVNLARSAQILHDFTVGRSIKMDHSFL